MRYLMMVIAGDRRDPGANPPGIEDWVREWDDRGVRLVGTPLDDPDTAASVRVRNGETLVTDGPFVEAKEFVCGFDVIDCADLDEAIDVAAGHPMAWSNAIEIRPFRDVGGHGDEAAPMPTDAELEDVASGRERYLMFMCLDGVPASEEVEAEVLRGAISWGEDLADRGVLLAGQPVAGQDAATTVRVQDGRAVVSDGPFTRAEEYIGGFAIVDVADRDEAIAHAAAHPLAAHHLVEVRRIVQLD